MEFLININSSYNDSFLSRFQDPPRSNEMENYEDKFFRMPGALLLFLPQTSFFLALISRQ